MKELENRYYVYAILDPRIKMEYTCENIIVNYQPFYIGYGQKNRIKQHMWNSELIKKSLKNNKIKSIIKSGNKPIFIKLIENLTFEEANELEIKLIKNFGRLNENTGILSNLTDGGGGVKNILLTEEMCEIRSDNKTGIKNNFYGKKHDISNLKSCKKVIQLDIKTNEIVNTYPSYMEAERFTNIKHIDGVCRGDRNSAGGFNWVYENQEKSIIVKKNSTPKKIRQIDINTGETINIFRSINNAEKTLKFTHIADACGNDKIVGGFKWEYTDLDITIETEVKKVIADNGKSKKIYQLDKENNILKEFSSLKEASEELSIIRSNISLCLSGKKKSAGGFHWQYA